MAPRLYLSASIANAPFNARLRELLPPPRFELVLPQEFTPAVPHADLPRAIYQRCLDEMDRCDAGVLLLDAFGVDCATEVGWLAARKKPVIAIAQAGGRFLQHWMVKGSLSGVVCLDPLLYAAVRSDPILRAARSSLCPSHAALGDHVEQMLMDERRLRCPATT